MRAYTLSILRRITTSSMFIRLIPTCATWTRRERKLFFHTWRRSSYLRLALVALHTSRTDLRTHAVR